MKKILLLAAAVGATLSASAQYFDLAPNYNPEMARQTMAHNKEVRKEIILPQVRGLNIYKADLHTHTIFSDAHVTPEYRVQEAWLDGLDATNTNMRPRCVVLHGWEYTTSYPIFPLATVGSFGCPVLSRKMMARVDDILKAEERVIIDIFI